MAKLFDFFFRCWLCLSCDSFSVRLDEALGPLLLLVLLALVARTAILAFLFWVEAADRTTFFEDESAD
jgi:hypothetical protein